MNQECILVSWDDDRLYIQDGPIASPPVMDVQSLIVMEGGELPAGTYYYAVTSIGHNGESAPYNILKVRAPYKENTILINWFSVDHIIEYRIYRGTSEHEFDGFIPFYGSGGSLLTTADTGDLVLQDSRHNPPEVTPLASPVYSIEKESIVKVDYGFSKSAEGIIVSKLYVSTKRDTLDIDLFRVLNKPSWDPKTQRGTRKAMVDLEKWINNGNIKSTKKVS